MSSFYTAYIFTRNLDDSTVIGGLHFSLFTFPDDVERDILLYLHIDDLVSIIRGLSRAARRRVNTLNIPNTANWFRNRPSTVTFSI